jgi:sterol desaturase/sphingolipid hydroxylase (fatty acid hydroxylase superfamily)
MLSKPQDVEMVSFFVLVLVFSAWENYRPARKIDHWADIKTDLLSFALAVFMNRISSRAVTSLAAAASPKFVLSSIHAVQTLPSGLKIGLAIVLVDFIIYWLHRAQHRFDWMWRTHAWHHSIEHMYWFAGFRTSFLHSFLYNIPQAMVPMLIFKLSPLETGVGYSIGLFIQFWEHTNVRVNIGPLKWIFITPHYHRIHHSATRNQGMNLGTTFSIWDRMFGTYVDPNTMPDSFPMGLGTPVEKERVPRLLLGV